MPARFSPLSPVDRFLMLTGGIRWDPKNLVELGIRPACWNPVKHSQIDLSQTPVGNLALIMANTPGRMIDVQLGKVHVVCK